VSAGISQQRKSKKYQREEINEKYNGRESEEKAWRKISRENIEKIQLNEK